MGKLFGTDGIRGVANRDLTPEMAFRIGRVAASVLSDEGVAARFIIGRDTRLSGPMLEGALAAGLASAGSTARLVGVVSTPAVAYLTEKLAGSAGVVISASHNPVEDNGLKFFDKRGYKLSDALEKRIEDLYERPGDRLPRPLGVELGSVINDGEAVTHYLEHLLKNGTSLEGLSLVADCAHGAACSLAGPLFSSLGATVKLLHGEEDGTRINVHCGATDTADLQEAVRREGAAVGLAFDGDADRLIAVDEKGAVVDGDAIMAICALDMAERGVLKNNTLVTTVMSNGGLEMLLNDAGVKILRTRVGDRHVLEKMLQGDYNLGGEQSGHIIFTDYASTGDGLLSALQLLRVLVRSGRPLSELASCLERLPQVLVNRPVASRDGWARNPRVTAAIKEVEDRLGPHGRVLVRPSGTELKIRVMLEGPLDPSVLEGYAANLAELIVQEQGKGD